MPSAPATMPHGTRESGVASRESADSPRRTQVPCISMNSIALVIALIAHYSLPQVSTLGHLPFTAGTPGSSRYALLAEDSDDDDDPPPPPPPPKGGRASGRLSSTPVLQRLQRPSSDDEADNDSISPDRQAMGWPASKPSKAPPPPPPPRKREDGSAVGELPTAQLTARNLEIHRLKEGRDRSAT